MLFVRMTVMTISAMQGSAHACPQLTSEHMTHMTIQNREVLECNRCGYRWMQQRLAIPGTCSNCRSPYWNKERVRRINPGKLENAVAFQNEKFVSEENAAAKIEANPEA